MSGSKTKNKHGRKGQKNKSPKLKKSTNSPKAMSVNVTTYEAVHEERERALAEVQVLRSALINIKAATEGSRWKEAKLAHELASEALG